MWTENSIWSETAALTTRESHKAFDWEHPETHHKLSNMDYLPIIIKHHNLVTWIVDFCCNKCFIHVTHRDSMRIYRGEVRSLIIQSCPSWWWAYNQQSLNCPSVKSSGIPPAPISVILPLYSTATGVKLRDQAEPRVRFPSGLDHGQVDSSFRTVMSPLKSRLHWPVPGQSWPNG